MLGGGGWVVVAPGIILSSPGTGGTLYFPFFNFPISIFHFPFPIPNSSIDIILFYFHVATVTYSPKSYGLLIIFSLIMLDSPRLLLLLSTWMGLGDHPETFLPKALFCKSTPSWLKVMGGWWWWWPVRLYCHLLGLPSPSPSQSQSQSLDKNRYNKYVHFDK